MQWFLTIFCSSSLELGKHALDLFLVHGWPVRVLIRSSHVVGVAAECSVVSFTRRPCIG